MKITYTGHGIEITPALRQYASEKFDLLHRHFDNIQTINIILNVEKIRQIAEAKVIVKGVEIHAKAESEDMYASIDTLIPKLNKQLVKHKEKITNHHHKEE